MAGLWKQIRDVNKAVIVFNDTTNIAFGAQQQSSIIDVSQYEDFVVGRNVTGGTYAFEVDWYAADLTTLLMTEAITTTNATTKLVPLAAPGARFRVKNTDGAVNFSSHRTWVCL